MFGTAAPPERVDDLRGRSFASTVGVWRVVSNGRSLVLKHVALGAGDSPRWPSEPEVDSQYYWRREVEVLPGLARRLAAMPPPSGPPPWLARTGRALAARLPSWS